MAANAVVMVVDDDAQLRSLVGTVLARAGHDVVEAADGEEALRLLDEKLPDLIVTDLAMPKMDGARLIEEVRKRDPMLPMIVLTGLGTVDKAVEMMRKGACDFIAKPFKHRAAQRLGEEGARQPALPARRAPPALRAVLAPGRDRRARSSAPARR